LVVAGGVVVVVVVWWPPHPAAANRVEMVARARSCKVQPILRRRPSVKMAAVLRSPNGKMAATSKLRSAGVIEATGVSAVRVSVEVMAAEPLGVTDVGERVQVELVGAPEQVRVTAWLKPPVGEMVTVSVTLEPRATVPVALVRAMENPAAGGGAVTEMATLVEVEVLKVESPE
jgi:hypothetical protein